jgi:hypothetical protein
MKETKMKRLWIISISLVCLILTTTGSSAGGPWGIRFRGGGQLTFNNTINGQQTDAHITWNFKLSDDPVPEINGHLSITEKLGDGSRRNFRLSGEQIETGGDPLNGQHTYFHCDSTPQEVRFEGFISENRMITVTFQEPDDVVSYEVIDPFNSSASLTDTGGFQQLNGHVLLECGQGSQNSQQGRISGSSSIYLPIVLSQSGN